MIHVTTGLLQCPSAPHVIFATPVRSNPILHDWVAVVPYVVFPASVSSMVPLPGLVGEPQSWEIKKKQQIHEEQERIAKLGIDTIKDVTWSRTPNRKVTKAYKHNWHESQESKYITAYDYKTTRNKVAENMNHE